MLKNERMPPQPPEAPPPVSSLESITVDRQDLDLLYQSAWNKAQIFFDWRHKLMVFSFTATGGGIVAAGWLIDKQADERLVGLLFLFLAALLVMTWAMDDRVAYHMEGSYRAGAFVEQKLLARTNESWPREGEAKRDVALPFEDLLKKRYGEDAKDWKDARADRRASVGTITWILKTAYLGIAVILAVVGVLLASPVIDTTTQKDDPQLVKIVR